MSQHQIRIHAAPKPSETRVVLDEEDITKALSGYILSGDARGGTKLTLRVGLGVKALISGSAGVEIDSLTHSMLTQLGWTPPADTRRCAIIDDGPMSETWRHATPHTCFLRDA